MITPEDLLPSDEKKFKPETILTGLKKHMRDFGLEKEVMGVRDGVDRARFYGRDTTMIVRVMAQLTKRSRYSACVI